MTDIAETLLNFFRSPVAPTASTRNIRFIEEVAVRASLALDITPQFQKDPPITETDLEEIRRVVGPISKNLFAKPPVVLAIDEIKTLPAYLSKIEIYLARNNQAMQQALSALEVEFVGELDTISKAIDQRNFDVLLDYFPRAIGLLSGDIPSRQADPFKRNRMVKSLEQKLTPKFDDKFDLMSFCGDSHIISNIRSRKTAFEGKMYGNTDDIDKINILVPKLVKILDDDAAAKRAADPTLRVVTFKPKSVNNGSEAHTARTSSVTQLSFPARGNQPAPANKVMKPLL